MIRLEAARKISITNKPTNDKLNGWKPLESKPRKDELWQAILERDSTKRCTRGPRTGVCMTWSST